MDTITWSDLPTSIAQGVYSREFENIKGVLPDTWQREELEELAKRSCRSKIFTQVADMYFEVELNQVK